MAALTHAQRRCHVAVVFLLYALFFLPLWVALPALQEYVIARRCLSMHGIFNNTGPVCGGTDVSESGQEWNTWIMLACNLPSVVVVLPLGRLMDVRGRRPIMLWCLATQLFGSAGMLAVCLFQLDLEWFMPPYVVNGLGGGSYALQSIFMASLTDVASSKRQRGVLLACATASYYACGCIGPLLGGFISGAANATALELFPALGGHQYQFAYLLFFASNALLLLAAIFFWRETLGTAVEAATRTRGGSTAPGELGGDGGDRCSDGRVTEAAAAAVSKPSWLASFAGSFAGAVRPLKSQGILVVALVFMLLYSTINVALNGLIITFAKLDRFDMDDTTVGWFLAVPWAVRATSASLLFPALLSWCVWAGCCSRTKRRSDRRGCCQAHDCRLRRRGSGSGGPSAETLLDVAGSDSRDPIGGAARGNSKPDLVGVASGVPAETEATAAAAVAVLDASDETCTAALWILRGGAAISVAVFSCFGLATSTPVLFVLCGVEGLSTVWDAACAVLLSTLADVTGDSLRRRTRLQRQEADQQSVGEGALAVEAAETEEGHRRHGGESPAPPAATAASGVAGGAGPVQSDQGSVLGLRALLQTSMACVGPFLFTEIYVATVAWDEVFVFYVLGAFCALALGLSFLFRGKDIATARSAVLLDSAPTEAARQTASGLP